MHGFVYAKEQNCKYPFRFEDRHITIYNRDAIQVNNADKYKIDLKCKVEYLIAEDIDTNSILILFISNDPFSSENWKWVSSESIRVYYYLELNKLFRTILFNKLVFELPELNYFFPITKGFKSRDNNNSLLTVEPIPFQKTKQRLNFTLNGNQIEIEFGVAGSYRYKSTSPLSFSSQLSCSFEGTNDTDFLIQIYKIIQRMFFFLCHRRSILFNSIKVKCIDYNDKYTVGQFHVLFDNKTAEDEDTIKETICIDYVNSHLNQLIQLISDDNLYTEHIPRDNESAHHITTASFVLDAAAFEWSFKTLYGKTEPKPSEYRINVKKDIINAIEELKSVKEYNAKEKGEANYYLRILKKTEISFSERVLYALKEFDDVLSGFIQQIYNFNNLKYDKKTYKRIANELQYYRNAFAHGDIDKELKGDFISDTIILEWLIYCIVLKTAEYTHYEIFNIVNIIFVRRFEDRETESE